MDRTAVTVLLVGPATVHGPRPVPAELAAAACAAIDDPRALVDGRVVDVDDLWRTVLRAAAAPTWPLVLVCPGWWHPARVDRIRRAAGARHTVRQRHTVHTTVADAIVEIAEEFVLVRVAGRVVASVPRLADRVADDVAARITVGGPVLIDVPTGVPGAAELAADIAQRCRAGRRNTTIVDDQVLLRQAGAPVRRRARRMAPMTVGAVLLAAGLGITVPSGEPAPGQTEPAGEGRVALRLPAGWARYRVVDGPGSPRLQAISPHDPDAAILLTQSPAGPDPAAVLAAALAAQPPGVFADFRATDHRGGRDVMSYTETRPGRDIEWAVFVDGPVRIAIGCQKPDRIREHCAEAVRSARTVPD